MPLCISAQATIFRAKPEELKVSASNKEKASGKCLLLLHIL
jgi:hypothetical protein